MWIHWTLPAVLILGLAVSAVGQEEPATKPGQEEPTRTAPEEAAAKPPELEVLQGYLGVWDAEIDLWPQGPEAPSIRFQGVETNRPYGEHWIASDFESEFMGEVMKVHSILGYDLDQEKLVGMIIDHGPYAASMSGDYDPASKAVHWTIEAKAPNGTPMVQKTLTTQKSAGERSLVLMMPGGEGDELTKFMQIRFVKRE